MLLVAEEWDKRIHLDLEWNRVDTVAGIDAKIMGGSVWRFNANK